MRRQGGWLVAALMLLCAADARQPLSVQGMAASGAAVTGQPVLIGGQDGANARSLLTETTGLVPFTIRGSGSRVTYSGANAAGTSTGTAASTTLSLAYLFHPSSVTLRYEILRIQVHCAGGSGSQLYTVRLNRITAEAGTPGGTTITPGPHDPADTASGGTFRNGATGAPTRAGADLETVICAAGTICQQTLYDITAGGKSYAARASTAEGWEAKIVTGGAALTTAATCGADFEWTEF
jgi:hypothetical protein